jgi:hypothetical protein
MDCKGLETMKRPAEYYTLWNLAVEAVEIYLARNPRELTENEIVSTCKIVQDVLTHGIFSGDIDTPIDTAGSDMQTLAGAALELASD